MPIKDSFLILGCAGLLIAVVLYFCNTALPKWRNDRKNKLYSLVMAYSSKYDILYYTHYATKENENFHRYMGQRMNEIEINQEQMKKGIARISALIDKEDE